MQDRSDRYQRQPVSNLQPPVKKLGSYLVDAGLLTADQIQVILIDQQATGMRFGEIAVARGWMKEQTIEWIVTKVVEPERQAVKQQDSTVRWRDGHSSAATNGSNGSNLLQNLSKRSADPVTPATNRATGQTTNPPTNPPTTTPKPYVRREVPISKPLPSVGTSDGDVNWVG